MVQTLKKTLSKNRATPFSSVSVKTYGQFWEKESKRKREKERELPLVEKLMGERGRETERESCFLVGYNGVSASVVGPTRKQMVLLDFHLKTQNSF